jgi:hypothetical protein
MSKRRINFLIASPPYTHIFAGVQVLHDLCHALNELGHNAAIIFFHSGDGQEKPYQWSLSNRPDLYVEGNSRYQLPLDNPQKTIAEFLKNGIMIYPEIIKGNPIGAKNVVRYILVKDDNEYPGEYICAFSSLYRKNPDHILFKTTTPEFMNKDGTVHWSERKMDATYFGKGPKYVECKLIPETILIERDWPRDQKQLAIMLKNTRFLFSFDGCSAITTDAMRCGAVPVIMHERQLTFAELNSGELKIPILKLLDINNKNSMQFNFESLEKEIMEVQNSFMYWKNSWKERVEKFAESTASYFSL